MTTTTPLRLESVDDYLGPAEARFFGSGYRRTRPRLRQIGIQHEGELPRLAAVGGIDAGAPWSTKGADRQEPHLSTPDIIALSVTAAEILLACTFSPSVLAGCHVEEMTIKAGGEPLESGLEAFAVGARMGPLNDGVVLIEVELPGFAVSMTARHPLGIPSFARVSSHTPDSLVGRSAGRVYSGTYALRSPGIAGITVDRAAQRAEASVCLPPHQVPGKAAGIESADQPGLNLIDVFVVTLQLGQILLYELDGLSRQFSSTLWMRRTHLAAPAPRRLTGDDRCEVSLERTRILRMGGDRWRAADIVGVLAGTTVTCGVAHRLGREDRPS